ncbi:MAG: carboxypeptidase regulatory-like domain-containing protein [Candidatus Aminicenantes bacterium]|nr:carboxypeptidase regulatory-like domain-containing protein [Candidatus Aminicenantes bacterium]
MSKRERFLSEKILAAVCLIVIMALTGFLRADDAIAHGQVAVLGVSLKIDPANQTAPVNTPTAVNTVFAAGSGSIPAGMTVKGELRGPGISGAIALSTLPGHAFAIPGLPQKGTYTLADIRLEKDGKTLLRAVPDQALIDVMDVIVTQVQTRPLTLDEIREKGIVITEENFTVYSFSIGLLVESEVVKLDFPVIFTPQGMQVVSSWGGGGFGGELFVGREAVPFELEMPESGGSPGEDPGQNLPSMAGLLVFNNKIGFLNQFFSAMFIISNNAPAGSSLVLKDLKATIVLPEGLREATTNPPHISGTPLPVRCPGPDGKIGTADDVDVILAAFSGMAEFLAEGLKEGTHTIRVDFKGTLAGLPSGDTEVKGSALGAVLVRNPEFSVVFSHPDVVRSGEEYDLYMTLTNTSKATANLVSLTMPKARLIGTELLSSERIEFETIPPGESQVGKFHMRSKQTGKVRATAFAAEGPVRGQFILTAGVGEQGIPLSPDTLVLPAYAFKLPANVIEAAMLLLGEAYCIAQSPAGLLPENLPVIKRETVNTRAVELIEAGQRIAYGEDLLPTLDVFLLDWLGNRSVDLPFDQLRRLTSKGGRLAAEIANIFNDSLPTLNLADWQMQLARTCAYKNPFFSAALAHAGINPACHLRIIDALANRTGNFSVETVREIPYGEYFSLPGSGVNPAELGVFGVFDNNGYRLEVKGLEAGFYDLSLIVPDTAGNLRQVRFNHVECRCTSLAWVSVNAASDSFVLANDLDNDGTADASISGNVIAVARPSLKLIAAIQDCTAHVAGHAVALFFNQAVGGVSAKILENYSCTPKKVLSAFLQPSQRVVIIGLDNPISPFVESRIRVSGLKDAQGNIMEPASVELPIQATITTPGGMVFGSVLSAAGAPIANAAMQLRNYDVATNSTSISTIRSDAEGKYQFDFVRMVADPFIITVKDLASGKIEKIRTSIRSHGQRLRIDIIMRGRGSLGGRVLLQDGVTPAAGAYVKANAENDVDTEFYVVKADDAGEFLIRDLPLGRVNLFAVKDNAMGYQVAALSYPGEIGHIDILLYPGQTGSIHGRVLANDGITAVAGTTVRLNRSGNCFAQANTDSEGNFAFTDVPVGTFSLQAYNPLSGLLDSSVGGTVYAGQTAEVTVILRGNGAIAGKVLSFAGTPCPQVTVYLNGTPYHTLTDSSGEFLLSDVPVGTYSVMAVDTTSGLSASAQVQLFSEGQQVRKTLVFPNTVTGGISGKVYLANGSPAVDVYVYAADGNYQIKGFCRSGNDGGFAFNYLPAGSYVLVAQKNLDGGVANAVLQYAGQFLNNKDIHFRGLGQVRVTTYAADGQTPVMANVLYSFPKILVKVGDYIGIMGDDMRVTTAADGQYLFGDTLAGDFRVEASSAFYPTIVSKQGKIIADTQVEVVLVLKPTGTINGRVVAPDGITPVVNAVVILKAKSLPPQTLNTDSAGEFIFTLVPPGACTVEAEDTVNGYRGSRNFNMGSDGQTIAVTVRLKGRGEVYGTVKTLQGAVVPNAQVTIRSVGFPDEKFTAIADSQGEFRQGGISEGDLALTAKDPLSLLGGRANGTLSGNNGSVQIDVVLETSGTVCGRVLDVDGVTTVASAQVILYHSRYQNPFGYCVSDQEGKFEFLYVPAGSFYVEVFSPASGRKGKKSGKIVADNETVDLDVLLEARGTVSGTFYDGSGVNPIAGAQVTIKSLGNYPFSAITTSSDSGGFRFDQIAQGNFELSAEDPASGQAGSAAGAIEYEGQTVQADIRAAATGIVNGRVFRADGVTIAANALLTLKSGQTTADAGGNYRFEYIPLGSFSLRAAEQNGRDVGYASSRIEFHGQEVTLDVRFNGLGTVAGTVKDAGGSLLADVGITLTCGNEEVLHSASDGSGAFQFPGIRVGSFELAAKQPLTGLAAVASGLLTQDGETASVEMVIESSGSIHGIVFNSDGSTFSEHSTVILTGGGSTRYRTVGADGSFHFDAIRLESYELKVEGWNAAGLFRSKLLLQNHGEVIDLGNIVLDDQIPQVAAVFPANGAGNLPLDTIITITFSEAMDAASLSKSFVLSGRQGAIAGVIHVAADGKSLTFQPAAPLPGFSSYTAVLAATAEDAAGNKLAYAVSASFTTLDNVAPAVLACAPANNMIQVALDSAVAVTFSEPIDTGKFTAANFSVKRSGVPVQGAISFASGNSVAVFTPAVLEANSVYTVVAKEAVDLSGNMQSAAYSGTFYTIDTVVPVLTLTPPAGGTTVKEGTAQTVKADVNGASDVAKVYFFINGELKFTDAAAPYQYTFNAPYISSLGQDTFLFEALAVDNVGNQSERRGLQFTLLADTPPQITLAGPVAASVLPRQTLTCPVQASDDITLKQVTFKAVGGNLDYQNVKTLNQIAYSYDYVFAIPADIAPGTVVTVSAAAVDSRGSVVSAASLVYTVPQDTQAPQIEISTPAAGAQFNYNELIQITALAQDDVGVKEVAFYVDGQLLAIDNAPPFAATYTALPYQEDTPLTIRAEALDVAGKSAAAEIAITVLRVVDPEAPTVKIVSPSNGALVYPEENLKITANASDDQGLTKVEFFVDGALVSADTEAPYEAQYAVPAGLADGTVITVRAKAWDVGEKSAYDEVQVSVLNGTVILAGTVISATDTQYDGKTVIIKNGTVTINGSHSFLNMIISESGIVTHSSATTSIIHKSELTIQGKLSIDSTSKINVGGRGYLGAYQGDNNVYTGRTLGNVVGSSYYCGGSYGGYGGRYTYTVNELYGSLYDPNDNGSGGGSNNNVVGGNGGGVVRIEANELVLDGTIGANGGSCSNNYGAGGSGGSVKVNIKTLSGSGTITADGGNSTYRGAGGGGRVAVYCEDSSQFTLANIHAYGGQYTGSTTAAYNGGAGTVYLKKIDEEAELIIDNRSLQAGNPIMFPVINPSVVTDVSANVLTNTSAAYMTNALVGMELIPDINDKEKTFTIIGNDATTISTDPGDGDLTQFTAVGKTYAGKMVFAGYLMIRNTIAEISRDIDLINLSLVENTVLRHPAATTASTSYLNIKAAEKVVIDSTSKINVGARGYLGAYQSGNSSYYGRTLGNVLGSNSYCGGGYGGYGGKYTYTVNELYGSLYDPNDNGSGGGSNNNVVGGNGGGVVRIEADELVLDGTIGANGGSCSNNYGAGGSGGSVKVNIKTLSGSGMITADGGNSTYRGAGGGGRVAVYCEDSSQFTLANIHAYGGQYTGGTTAAYNGGAGTIYLKAAGQEFGDLIVDNNNTATATTIYSTTLPAVGSGFNTSLEPFRLINSGAAFVPGALVGLELNPYAAGEATYTVVANDAVSLSTAEADGDMTLYSQNGYPYIGEHHLFNLTVKGGARVFTYDRIMTAGTLTVEIGSALKAENVER